MIGYKLHVGRMGSKWKAENREGSESRDKG